MLHQPEPVAEWKRFFVLACVVFFAIALPPRTFASDPTFEQVSRILGQRCLHCHNGVDKEADFSVETRTSMIESGYLIPGNATDSELIVAVTGSQDLQASMPKNGEPLSTEEVAILAAWIDAGAKWPSGASISNEVNDFDWWSFQPIDRPTVPRIRSSWIRTPIDSFIAAKHQDLGLTHSAPADRRTLIRRVTYDLTGLPPTPAQVREFLQDTSDRAYENLVDRLLASPSYGERWARHWLDVVKYADTCGYDKDKLRPNAWPYRDYVIRSFNDDKPYSQFVQEQVAGDALFPGEADGLLGLGFLAAGPWDFIGHVEVPETKLDGKVARNLDRDEMVTNTMNTFCSLTVQCARCHNHKFDPFTQEHYYSTQAVFAAVDRADRAYDLDPVVAQRRQELKQLQQELESQKRQLERAIADEGGKRLKELDEQIRVLSSKIGVRKSAQFGYHSQIESAADRVKWVEIDLGDSYSVSRIILHATHDNFAGIGAGFGFPRQYQVELRTDPQSEAAANTPQVIYQSSSDERNPGLQPVIIDVGEQDAQIIRVLATQLAERKNDYIFALAEVQVIDPSGANVAANATVRALDSIEAPPRWSMKNLTDAKWATSSNPESERTLSKRTRERDALLSRLNTDARKKQRTELTQKIDAIKRELQTLPSENMVYAVTTDFKPQGNFKPTLGKPRAISVLHRGEVQQPVMPVGPGRVPLAGGDDWRIKAETEQDRRAALARWLTSVDHPLVWRSIVNRVWQYHFGEGIVSTPNDFGRMGEAPTNQALLDWLAIEFRDNGQSMKQLHRLIVTSSVYRQSSRNQTSNQQIDQDNRFLWRMNRRRLTAEEIRDSILTVSGRTDTKMGGPGFYLFALEKTEHSPHYEYHKFDPSDPKSHRRSVYRFIVRSQPDPYMTTLDCADSSQSTPKRIETLTSLQALSLLNNRFNLEMSGRFSERLTRDNDTLESQVASGFESITGRKPHPSEHDDLVKYAQQHGLRNLCRVLFNLSEFVFID